MPAEEHERGADRRRGGQRRPASRSGGRAGGRRPPRGTAGPSGAEREQKTAPRRRAEPEEGRAAACCVRQSKQIDTISRRFNYRVTIRAPPGATPLDLLEQAKQAARLPDLFARITLVNGGGGERAVHQWDELRVWDPGD